jgi:hypothetical protein
LFSSLELTLFTDCLLLQYFKEVMNIIVGYDNIALVILKAELKWKCFIKVLESWKRIFKDLKILYIDFGDTYEGYMLDCVSGLKTVLK